MVPINLMFLICIFARDLPCNIDEEDNYFISFEECHGVLLQPTVVVFPYSCWETVASHLPNVGIKSVGELIVVKSREEITDTYCLQVKPCGAKNGNYFVFSNERLVLVNKEVDADGADVYVSTVVFNSSDISKPLVYGTREKFFAVGMIKEVGTNGTMTVIRVVEIPPDITLFDGSTDMIVGDAEHSNIIVETKDTGRYLTDLSHGKGYLL